MTSIPHERYRLLKAYAESYDFGPWSRTLQNVLCRGAQYVADINAGRRNFEPDEIKMLLEHFGLACTRENILKYFPPMGLELQDEVRREQLRKELIELLGGVA